MMAQQEAVLQNYNVLFRTHVTIHMVMP